jgi:hypothetical protein
VPPVKTLVPSLMTICWPLFMTSTTRPDAVC